MEKFDSPANLLKDVTSLFYELASNIVIEKKKDDNTIDIDLQEQKMRLYEAEINCRIQISQIEVKSKTYF